MTDDARVRGIFVKGGDILEDFDEHTISLFQNHLKAKYGGTWKYSHKEDGLRLLDQDHFEDGVIVYFKKR